MQRLKVNPFAVIALVGMLAIPFLPGQPNQAAAQDTTPTPEFAEVPSQGPTLYLIRQDTDANNDGIEDLYVGFGHVSLLCYNSDCEKWIARPEANTIVITPPFCSGWFFIGAAKDVNHPYLIEWVDSSDEYHSETSTDQTIEGVCWLRATHVEIQGGYPTNSVIIELNEIDNTGVSGTATLTDLGSAVLVEIQVTGAPDVVGGNPIHIHEGACDNLDPAPAYPLQEINEDGLSTTVVEGITLGKLLNAPTYGFAINAHLSAVDIGVYIACGNITA